MLTPSDYSSTLFEKSVGFSAHMSALMSGFLQTWFFVASFIPWVLIDRIGRRPLVSSSVHSFRENQVDNIIASIHDQRYGCDNGCSSWFDLSGREQHSIITCGRNCSCSNAVHLSGSLHYRFPSNRLGLPVSLGKTKYSFNYH